MISNNIPSLQRMQKKWEIYFTFEGKKLKYLGQVMKNEKFYMLQLIIEGKIQASPLKKCKAN